MLHNLQVVLKKIKAFLVFQIAFVLQLTTLKLMQISKYLVTEKHSHSKHRPKQLPNQSRTVSAPTGMNQPAPRKFFFPPCFGVIIGSSKANHGRPQDAKKYIQQQTCPFHFFFMSNFRSLVHNWLIITSYAAVVDLLVIIARFIKKEVSCNIYLK